MARGAAGFTKLFKVGDDVLSIVWSESSSFRIFREISDLLE